MLRSSQNPDGLRVACPTGLVCDGVVVDGDEDGSAASEPEQALRKIDITIPIVAAFTGI
jgi:hypothetical protein